MNKNGKGKSMSGRSMRVVGILVVAVYMLSSAGCAAAWFLAGAGTAATVAYVSSEEKKDADE